MCPVRHLRAAGAERAPENRSKGRSTDPRSRCRRRFGARCVPARAFPPRARYCRGASPVPRGRDTYGLPDRRPRLESGLRSYFLRRQELLARPPRHSTDMLPVQPQIPRTTVGVRPSGQSARTCIPPSLCVRPPDPAQRCDHPTGICHFSYKQFLNDHNCFWLDTSQFGHAATELINAQGLRCRRAPARAFDQKYRKMSFPSKVSGRGGMRFGNGGRKKATCRQCVQGSRRPNLKLSA